MTHEAIGSGRARSRRAVLGTGTALALAACAAAPPNGALPDVVDECVRFRCGERTVDARFLDDGAAVELVAEGLDERLPRAPAASGAKYEQGIDAAYRLFWVADDAAVLAVGAHHWWACTPLPLPETPLGDAE